MSQTILKKLVFTLELLFGVLISGLAIWSYTGIYRCPENTHDCEGWALLGTYILAPIGILFIASGLILFKSKSWLSQLVVLPALIWGGYWWWI